MSFINNTERNQPKIPRVNVPKMQQPFPRSESLIFNCVHTYVRSYFHIYIYFLLFLLYDVSMDYTYIYIHYRANSRTTDWSVRFRFFLYSESNPEILDTRSIRISTRCAVRKACRTVVIRCSMFKWYGGNEKLVKWWNCLNINPLRTVMWRVILWNI